MKGTMREFGHARLKPGVNRDFLLTMEDRMYNMAQIKEKGPTDAKVGARAQVVRHG